MPLRSRQSRGRQYLWGVLAIVGAVGLGLALGGGHGQVAEAQPAAACATDLRHLSWVWRFSSDGEPEAIVSALAEHHLGVLLKTHDGTTWMARYDSSPQGVSGPEQIEVLAQQFETQGVPFHAWAVVKGLHPKQEAKMAAQVLAAGARSIVLDLEPWRGFWQGTAEDALTFGQELRRLQPNAIVITAIDPRPWAVERVPVAEFASFSNALAPLIYWESFNTPRNWERYVSSGWPPPTDSLTPEFLLDVAASILEPYNLPIQPVGQGASQDINAWTSFLDHAFEAGMPAVSVWRHGVTDPQVYGLLKERAPSGQAYVVQPGDTLWALAQRWGVSVDSIVQVNDIANPNLIWVGQVLCVPGGGVAVNVSASPSPGGEPTLSGQTYVVQPGDTLWALAQRWGVSVDSIVQANRIADPNFILVGQVLVIP